MKQNPLEGQGYIPIQDAAAVAGVTLNYFYTLVSDGKVERVKLGGHSYILRTSLDQYLQQRGEVGEEPKNHIHINEVAQKVGVTPDGVLRWIRTKKVTAVKYKRAYWINRQSLYDHLGPIAKLLFGDIT